MRQLKYYVACTVDRFIAHPDGTHDGFLTEGEHFADLIATFPETFPAHFRDVLGISGENKCFDTVLMGRKTYEVGLKVGVTNPYPQMQQHVFSRTLTASPDRNIELISTDPVAVVKDLKQQQGKDIMPFNGALEYILNQMQCSQLWHPWLPYLFIFRPDFLRNATRRTLRERAVVGLGGFKSVPDAQRTIEIGCSVAPTYQGQGFATSAARQLIEIAFASKLVDCVCAHTLAENNASTRVLTKCGMTKKSETVDSDLGNLWRWEISAACVT
jgi:[ribosomal protein S5]-alanine N-acetyltransferase